MRSSNLLLAETREVVERSNTLISIAQFKKQILVL